MLTCSDFPSQRLELPWGDQEYKSSRIQATRHVIGGVPFLHANVYGFARGPTFPAALQLTERLLRILTLELVIGGRGPRLIVGDFNASSHELQTFEVWRTYGWVSLQEFAHLRCGWEVQPTSKGKCERDLIWLSPEAAELAQSLRIEDVFTDHATLSVDLAVPLSRPQILTWPRPAKIPWSEVPVDWSDSFEWQNPGAGTVEQRYMNVFAQMENSLDGCLQRAGASSLTTLEKGRAQRLQPKKEQQIPAIAKASRHGEVCMRNNLIDRTGSVALVQAAT